MPAPAQWPAASIAFHRRPSADAWELLSTMLLQAEGVLGLEEYPTTPGRSEPPDWVRVFGAAEEGDRCEEWTARLRAVVSEQLGEPGPDRWEIAFEWIENQDWGANWRQYFRLTRVTERLFVGPPWDAELPADAPKGALVLKIEPGQAFGTGTHATTQLCLRMLERLAKPETVLLDVGAGSGILSIATVRFGAEAAFGLEHDDVCAGNFAENCQLNGVGGRAHFVLGKSFRSAFEAALLAGSAPPNLIACNMLMEEFTPYLAPLAKLHLPMVLSGFLMAERDYVLDLCRQADWALRDESSQDDWGVFVLDCAVDRA
ncbi:MAG: 50S ribosomal protein L11 methyltransferase [Candidatus Sumerlaeia bacterium]|nr:50S ribosomal protein L11 methyltransferase [Candidatus Sumerlaeia bacterium]